MNHTAEAMQDVLYAGRVLIQMYDEALPRLGADSASELARVAEEHRERSGRLAEAVDQADFGMAEAGDDMSSLMNAHLRLVRSAIDESSILQTLELAEQTASLLCEVAERYDLPEEVDELVSEQHAADRLHASVLADRVPRTAGVMDAHPVACVTGGMTDDRSPDDFE